MASVRNTPSVGPPHPPQNGQATAARSKARGNPIKTSEARAVVMISASLTQSPVPIISSLIVSGMWLQAVAIGVVVVATSFRPYALGGILLGIGTAMVYPTLLSAIGHVAQPSWRASSVGVYRLWRDLGYAIGALLAGVTADALGLPVAMRIVGA